VVCVFAGGFTIPAAEAVSDPAGGPAGGVLEGLDALLEAGLLVHGPAPSGEDRFTTLQTVREYGLERLRDGGEEQRVRERHASFYLALAERARPESRGPNLLHFLQVLEPEHDNFRAALGWAMEDDRGDVALPLVWALWRFWHMHGDLSAGRRWAEQALGLPSSEGRSAARARALIAAGSLAYWQQDVPAMLSAFDEGLDVFRELEDTGGVAEATYNWAFALTLAGDLTKAGESFRASHGLFEQLGETGGIADSLFGLSILLRLQGDLEAARSAAEEALRLHEELEDLFGIYGSLFPAGRTAAELGDLVTGRRHLLRALAMAEGFGDRTGIALSLDNLADQEITGGQAVRGIRLAAAAAAIKESVAGQAPPELTHLADPRERAGADLSEETIGLAWEEGRAMTLEQALAYAREMP
jgi:tetratricopeptide (TPR) repeat protein